MRVLTTHCRNGHERTAENTIFNKDGYRLCKICRRNWRANWRERNPDYHKRHDLQRAYKISLEAFQTKLKTQNNRCEICQEVMTRPVVDHNHNCCSGTITCGKCVRGLLCEACNLLLGRFKENTETLKSAISYIEKYQEQ